MATNPRETYEQYMRRQLGLKRPVQTPFSTDPVRPNVLRKLDMGTGDRPVPANRPGVTATTFAGKPGTDLSGVKEGLDKITPFVSNIANMFRKPPKPKMPHMVSAASVIAPKLDAERVDIDRSVRGATQSADKNLDANSAAAVKATAIAQGVRAKGQSFANEAELDLRARNATAQNISQADAINAAKMDQYDQNKVGMQMAQQREQSENLSNAADKVIAQQTVTAQQDLELKKFDIMSKMYGSGVLDRLVRGVLKKGANDPLEDIDRETVLGIKRMNGGKLRYAVGGMMGPGDPVTPRVGTPQERQSHILLANRLAKQHNMDGAGNLTIGKYLPEFVGATGAPIPTKVLPTVLPRHVKPTDVRSEQGIAWYVDPKTGDTIDVDPSLAARQTARKDVSVVAEDAITRDLTTRFRGQMRGNGGVLGGAFKIKDKKKQNSTPPEMASSYKANGGYIGGGIGRGKERKLRKVY